jgi:hypothetical protein
LKSTQFSRYSTTFLTMLQVSTEMNKNRHWSAQSTPSWIYFTGKQHKAFLFECLFSCFCALFLQLLPHGSYLSFAQVFCHYALAPLCHLSYGMLTAPFYKCLPSHSRSHGTPLLAFIVLHTLTFLSSNIWANSTLL